MRKPLSSFSLLPLAAALAVTGALAAARPAAQVAPAASGMTAGSITFMQVTPVTPTASAPTAAPATSGSTSGGSTSTSSTGTTSAANATTVIGPQGTPSSATASGTPTRGQTSGVSASGTSSGDAFSGASRGDAPAVGAAAITTNANGTTTTVATNGAIVTTGPTGIPIITDNGLVAGGVSMNGERLVNPATVTTELAGTTNFGIAESELPQVGVATSAATDPAVRKELRKRQNLKRNGQLLYSIAPRTNVDRTWQAPDDGPTPALRTSP